MSYLKACSCLKKLKTLLEKKPFTLEYAESGEVYLKQALLILEPLLRDDKENFSLIAETKALLQYFYEPEILLDAWWHVLLGKVNDLISTLEQLHKNSPLFFQNPNSERGFFDGPAKAAQNIPEKPTCVVHFCVDVDGTASLNSRDTGYLNTELFSALQKLKKHFEDQQHEVQFHLLTNRSIENVVAHMLVAVTSGMPVEKMRTQYIIDSMQADGLLVTKVSTVCDLIDGEPGFYYKNYLARAEAAIVDFINSYDGEKTAPMIKKGIEALDVYQDLMPKEQQHLKSSDNFYDQMRAIFLYDRLTQGHYKATLFHQLRSNLEKKQSDKPAVYIVVDDLFENAATLQDYALIKGCDAVVVHSKPGMSEQDYFVQIARGLDELGLLDSDECENPISGPGM